MIKDDYVEVILNSKNLKRLYSLGYKGKVKDIIKIKIEDLSVGSNILINVECSVCKHIKKVKYLNYNKQTDNNNNLYYCSDCKSIKTKNTCLEKYGVDNPMKLNIVKEKSKQTCLEKYGVDNIFKN